MAWKSAIKLKEKPVIIWQFGQCLMNLYYIVSVLTFDALLVFYQSLVLELRVTLVMYWVAQCILLSIPLSIPKLIYKLKRCHTEMACDVVDLLFLATVSPRIGILVYSIYPIMNTFPCDILYRRAWSWGQDLTCTHLPGWQQTAGALAWGVRSTYGMNSVLAIYMYWPC